MNAMSAAVGTEQRRTVHQWVATLVEMEATLASALGEQRGAVAEYSAAREAVERFQATVEQHADKLRTHLEQIGGNRTQADRAIVARLEGLVGGPLPALGGLPVSTILW